MPVGSWLALTLALGAVRMLGVDPALVDVVAVGVGSPLWFLAAFLIAQCAVPWMSRLHERAPRATLVALAAGAVLIDVVRITTGIQELGLANLFFVWLFVQQLGFWYSDGWFRRRRIATLLGLAVAAYLVVAVLLGILVNKVLGPTSS